MKLLEAEAKAPTGTVHKIPYVSLGRMFKGRRNDFVQLIKQLADDSTTTAITQAIHGLGGVGKTRLAVEYGWYGLLGGDYKAVLFVNCSQELAGKEQKGDKKQQQIQQKSAFERLCVEMAKLAVANVLAIPSVDSMEPANALAAVLKELHGRDEWLIVFDNVDEPAMADAVNEILPQLNNGKVIITSRLTNFASGIRPLSLQKLTEEASIEYLTQKTDKRRRKLDNDQEKVKELADKLDGLPVALEQAAAYIDYKQISFEAYLDRFKVMEEKLLGFNAPESELDKDFKPVLTVWALTEEQLGPVARAVNTLTSFLAPDAIPESLFTNQSEGVLAVTGELDSNFNIEQYKDQSQTERADIVEDAIAQLGGYSMISRDASKHSFSIHRLVQEVNRLRLSKGHIEIFTQLILTMIHNDCPDYQTAIKNNFSWHKAMDNHISGIIAFTKRLWPDTQAIPEEIAGPLATQANNLAEFYSHQARYAEAEPLMERALQIDKKSLSPDHPDVARDLNNLAQLYKATNRLKEAEPLMKRVVEILENPGGEPLPNYAAALNNRACCPNRQRTYFVF